MAKPIIHEFQQPIYPIKLWVCISKNTTDLKDKFRYATSGKSIDVDFIKSNEAVTFYVQSESDNSFGVLIASELKSFMTTRNIVHESTHAAKFIWDHVNESVIGDEANAYLTAWIADCCEQAVKYKK